LRRRLFWTIAGVAAATGLLVLVGAAFASQRAAVEATYREMRHSSDEAAAIAREALDREEHHRGAFRRLLGFLEGQEVGPRLGRIARTAGGSEIAFAVAFDDGELRTDADLFSRIRLDIGLLAEGESQFTRSADDELVVVAPIPISAEDAEAMLLLALAREAPVVRLGDQLGGMLLIAAGIGALSAALARLLSGQVARRLTPLASASRDLAEGDLSARVPGLGDPELDEVASAFNEMASELEASARRERELIMGIGHDLRTPLTTIGGYAEALEAGEVAAEEVERVGAVLGRQSRQLSRLIEDLSTLARLDQPEFSLRLEEVDIGAHVAEIVEGFRRRADEAGVELTVEAADGLLLETDPDRLGQIAQNLVENALRFTPETGRVAVAVGPDGDADSGARIVVADTGVGIAPEDLPHVLDRRYVGRLRPVRAEGSGLGLSIVAGLAARLGGSVAVDSTPGKGAVVTVTLQRTGSRP